MKFAGRLFADCAGLGSGCERATVTPTEATVSSSSYKEEGDSNPGMEVSWQVTGVRHDAWANARRVQVEVEKPAAEKDFNIHPELFGAPKEKSIAAARHPALNHQPERQASKLLKQQQ